MATKFLLLAIAIGVILGAVNCQRQAQCCEEYCYDLDSERPQSAHFGTKTAYQVVKGSETGRQYIVPSKKLKFNSRLCIVATKKKKIMIFRL